MTEAPAANETPWVPCPCGEVWCRKHSMHAFECPCAPVDEWPASPYDPEERSREHAYPEGHR